MLEGVTFGKITLENYVVVFTKVEHITEQLHS